MKRRDVSLADLPVSTKVVVLATLLLLILNATSASAQRQAFAGNHVVLSDSTPVARGKARVTWPKATRALLRGETLRAEDFVLVDTVIVWNWSGAPTDTNRAIAGWVTRRPFAQGEFMRAPGIAPANVITLGQTVKVLWQDGAVRLTLSGTATNNAALGAPVGVRIDKNRRLDGIAVGPNTVRLR